MPCWQAVRKRAGRLGFNLEPNLSDDREVQKELRAETHEEVHQKIDAMPDWEFIDFIRRLQAKKRRRGQAEDRLEVVSAM